MPSRTRRLSPSVGSPPGVDGAYRRTVAGKGAPDEPQDVALLNLEDQLAQSNGALLVYEPRAGGGSIFRLVFADPARWETA